MGAINVKVQRLEQHLRVQILYCTRMYCSVLYHGVLLYTRMYCTVLYCYVLYVWFRYCTVLYCTATGSLNHIPHSALRIMHYALCCLCCGWYHASTMALYLGAPVVSLYIIAIMI